MQIGVSGDIGSFSEEVGYLYAKKAKIANPEIKCLIDMEGVLVALNKGDIDLGVFPVVNNNSGLVRPAFVAMGKYNFEIIDEWHLDVRQCLFAKKKLDLAQIQTIYSYPPAFNQCKIFLQKKIAKTTQLIDWGDMAKAARDLANGKLDIGSSAVIGSIRSAKEYGLYVLATNIQDVKPNITMFIIVKARS